MASNPLEHRDKGVLERHLSGFDERIAEHGDSNRAGGLAHRPLPVPKAVRVDRDKRGALHRLPPLDRGSEACAGDLIRPLEHDRREAVQTQPDLGNEQPKRQAGAGEEES